MNPITRQEQYLAKIAGDDVAIPEYPITREEQYLARIVENGTGGGGGAFHYKGTVLTKDELPDDAEVGDSYIVEADGNIYAWNGESWDNTGTMLEVESITDAQIDALFT